MPRDLSPELKLVALCCSWPPTASSDVRIATLASRISNWEQFEALVRHHRVRPLVHAAIHRTGIDVPKRVADILKQAAYAEIERSLRQASECIRLQYEFAHESIPMLVIKGAPLAALAYNSVAMKESRDIDILVDPEDAVRAASILRMLSYELTEPELSEEEFIRFIPHSKEAAFLHTKTGVVTELHWRLVDTGQLLRHVGAQGPTQDVALSVGSLATLANQPLFAYLCLHGASHNWFRLKWLADLNAFLGTRDEAELERLVGYADTCGAGRCASVAMQLCHDLFAPSWLLPLRNKSYGATISRMLRRNVIKSLNYRGGGMEPLPYTVQWLRVLLAAFFVTADRGHILAQARFLWTAPLDRAKIPLPRGMSFLYHVFRMPSWLWRVTARAIRATKRRA